jgi:hypothetical protein
MIRDKALPLIPSKALALVVAFARTTPGSILETGFVFMEQAPFR